MKNLADIILEKLNLSKVKKSSTLVYDKTSFVNVYKVESKISKQDNNYIGSIKMDNHVLITANKQSVIDFISNWVINYPTEYNIDFAFFKFGSRDTSNHIFFKIIENIKSVKILANINIYNNIITLNYMDRPEIEEIIYTFLDDIISNFPTNN